MDTRWKKSKVIISFLAFVMGLTILVSNIIPAVSMAVSFGTEVFTGQPDYQTSGEFRNLISGRLNDLLRVATGGELYSVSDSTGAVYKFSDVPYGEWNEEWNQDWDQEWWDRFQNETALAQEETVVEESADYAAYLAEQQAHYEEMMMAEYGYADGAAVDDYIVDQDYDGYYIYRGDYYGYDYSDQESLESCMAVMARNKNLRYAVVYQDKLLYTNIEDYEGKTGQEWTDTDFYESLDKNEYNFSLWYNRAGDGRVEIVKDGLQEDVYDEVYGDGVYHENSRWRVPGYPNFTIEESAKEAVVFLAAAKNPKLYLVRDDGSSHVTQYGSRLYDIKQNMTYLYSAAKRVRLYLTAAVILLGISLLMWKSRKQGVEKVADILAKVCLEGKLFLLILLILALSGMSSMGVFSQFIWWLRNGLSYYCWSGDYIYETAKLSEAGRYMAAYVWLIYLAVLDFRMNRGRQKTPIFDLLKMKDLKYPIQRRLVRRQRLILIAELVILMLFAVSLLVLWLFAEEYLNWISGGYAYDYGYEAIAEYGGYPFGIGGAYMLIAYVTFTALFIFTLSTFCSLKKNHRLAVDIGALSDQILALREGNVTGKLQLSEDTDLQEAADNLNEIQKGMETALAERVKSERMKVELVTNVSHDIKTPLTSIISYVELLRQEEELPQHVKEYIQILGEKSERLSGIVQDVFEVSKAASGQLPIQMETLDMGKLLRQTLADMDGQIGESTLTMKTAIPQEPVWVQADGQRLYRVFQNLLQNALRYSLEGSRVYLTLMQEAEEVVVRVKNTSSVELAGDRDFTERFVRGDESRTDGGSGLGLSIAKSFTEACGGKFSVETDADLFTVTVRFGGMAV